MREGIAALLTDLDIPVLATAATAGDLLAAVAEHQPDVAIVDVRMPPTFTDEGLWAALAIRYSHPDTAVLVFSQWVETTYARRLLQASGVSHEWLAGGCARPRVTAGGRAWCARPTLVRM